MRHKTVPILLAVGVASLAMVASAQTTGAEQVANVYAAPSSRSIATPAALNSGAARDESSSVEPTNVLEDTPRDTSAKPASRCAHNPLDGQMPAACRRQLEIAGTL
jgi:hypothetical protein